MFAKAHGRNHDQDIITDRSEVGIRRVVEGHERMGKTIEPVILTMAGGRFSVWSLVNGAQHSPSRVKSGPGAACYASRWDVAPGGPDRARSCHWPPLTPPHIARRVRHAGLFLELPTWKPGIFREDPPWYRSDHFVHCIPRFDRYR